MSEHEPTQLTAIEEWAAAENAHSIADIPAEQLPDHEARAELTRRALDGQDVYAYRPAFQPEYVVWVRQPDPATESRFAPMHWARLWRAGLQPEHRKEQDE
jgi:hypothetical protein